VIATTLFSSIPGMAGAYLTGRQILAARTPSGRDTTCQHLTSL
jgi:hypothetical protein